MKQSPTSTISAHKSKYDNILFIMRQRAERFATAGVGLMCLSLVFRSIDCDGSRLAASLDILYDMIVGYNTKHV